MNHFSIIDQHNQIISISEQQLQQFLQIANQQSGEPNFQAPTIVQTLISYLEIFLSNSSNTLSQQQLVELVNKILTEQQFFQTATQFSLLLENYSPEQLETPSSSEPLNTFSKPLQEKLILLFQDKNPHQTFDQLLSQISSHNCSREITKAILPLIKQKTFFPHQNTLKQKSGFDIQYINLEDDLNHIFDGVKQLAINCQNNISTFLNFSNLRPKLSLINTTQGLSAGPVSFIKIFTTSYEALRQNLQTDFNISQHLTLNIHHPDILEYLIFIKNSPKTSSNRNFQFLIEITPAFREALQKEDDFELINPQNHQVVNYLSAKNTFDLIVSSIEENPQLGLLNLTEQTSAISPKNNFVVISGVLNLANYCRPDHTFHKQQLIKDLKNIQLYLQAQATYQKAHHPNIQLQLNLTGLADLLIRLKVSFTSVQNLEFIQQLTELISQNLSPEIHCTTNLNSPLLNLLENSKGLETYEYLIINKTSLSGQESFQIIPELLNQLQKLNLTSSDLLKQISENNSLQSIYQIPSELKSLFLTSYELDSQFHLQLQSQFEQIFKNNFDKKIYLDSNLDQNKLKQLISDSLTQNLGQFRFCTFNKLLSSNENTTENNQKISSDKNFLHNLNQHRKRRSQQIQPPLFQIKKTEEVLLPPINSNKIK